MLNCKVQLASPRIGAWRDHRRPPNPKFIRSVQNSTQQFQSSSHLSRILLRHWQESIVTVSLFIQRTVASRVRRTFRFGPVRSRSIAPSRWSDRSEDIFQQKLLAQWRQHFITFGTRPPMCDDQIFSIRNSIFEKWRIEVLQKVRTRFLKDILWIKSSHQSNRKALMT